MPRKTPAPALVEISGQEFPSLAAAQENARPQIAGDLVSTLRFLLDTGRLIIDNGRVIPNPNFSR